MVIENFSRLSTYKRKKNKDQLNLYEAFKARSGDPLGCFKIYIYSVAKDQKIEGGPLGTTKFEKSLTMPK